MADKNRPKRRGQTKLMNDIYQQSVDKLQKTQERERLELERKLSDSDDSPGRKACPRCGRPAGIRRRLVLKELDTKFGKVQYRRHYHYCGECEIGFYPRDIELGLEDRSATEDVIDWALDFAVNDSFERAAMRLDLHHGIPISGTRMKHIFEAETAALADAEEPAPTVALPFHGENRRRPAVIMNDGSMVRYCHGWGEIRLMSVGLLEDKNRVYLADCRDSERFGKLLSNSSGYDELEHREVLWIADGAVVNWNLQQLVCPGANCLVDFWHVSEHAYECARELFGAEDECVGIFAGRILKLLLNSDVNQLLKELNGCRFLISGRGKRDRAEALRKFIVYIENQSDRLNYKQFIDNGWPIGSGEIESAHKWVLQKRMKQSGMKWSRKNAQRMATARAIYASVGPKKFSKYLHAA